ncbi:MAG: isopeptide-forming domain-containing fimbrial protein, partial [Patescibacteria group bacterium]
MQSSFALNFLDPYILIGSGLILLAISISLPNIVHWQNLVVNILLATKKIFLYFLYNAFNLLPKITTLLVSIIVIAGIFNGLLTSENVNVQANTGAIPQVTANISSAATIGNQFNFTLIYSNLGDGPGFAPYIDLIVPTIGVDGAGELNEDDGITINSAQYLEQTLMTQSLTFPETGLGCNPGETPVEHPYAVDNAGTPLVICGIPGNTLMVLTLPFGSFVPEQSGVEIEVTGYMSEKADNNTPIDLEYRAGFRFGNDPLNNFTTDPSIVSEFTSNSIEPVLFAVRKVYNGPESETVTGPNFKRRYTINADLGDGQTVTDLDLIDKLPNNLSYFQLISSTPAGAIVINEPTIGLPANDPDNLLTVRFPSVTGTAGSVDAQVVFEYFVPDKDANGDDIINHTSGNDTPAQNDALGQGMWTPVDTRDDPSVIISDASTVDHTLIAKSIAIQKSVNNLSNNSNRPGDNIEYSLDFQISDYFGFQNINITDVMSDGQSFDTSFTPTLTINETGSNSSGNFDISNYNFIKDTGATNSTGETTINFSVSQELQTRNLDSQILGGCLTSVVISDCDINQGAATGRIVFRANIDQEYTDNYGDGNPNVDMGDMISNNVTISGDVLDNPSLLPTGEVEGDGSSAGLDIVIGDLEKTVYAINGVINPTPPLNIGPGDTITYRLKYILSLTDTEDFYIEDFLPLPTLQASNFSTTFGDSIDTTLPTPGSAKFGPDETFNTISGIVPTITADSGQNKIRFDYGGFQDNLDRSAVTDILIRIEANNEPFANGLNLINQARARTMNTFETDEVASAITPVTLLMPEINMTKGVVATDNLANEFLPEIPAPVSFNAPGSATCTTTDHRFSDTINSTNLASLPIISDVSNLDGSDLVTYALTFENLGGSPRGAFDIQVKDTLTAGDFVVPSTGLNLCITRGDGTILSYTPIDNTDTNPFLEDGISIADIDNNNGSISPYDETSGTNIIIITYDLQVDPNIDAGSILENSATFLNYTGASGGTTNFVPNNSQTDSALVSTTNPTITKSITNTSESDSEDKNVMVGEIIDYQLLITVPEGQTAQAKVVDALDSGLALVSLDSITDSPTSDLSTSLAGGFNDVLTNAAITDSGQTIEFDFGTITNTNTQNADENNLNAETITIAYSAIVLNSSDVNRDTLLNNSAIFSYNNGTQLATDPASAEEVTVIEPELEVQKSISSATGDARDLLTYTLVVSHTPNSNAPAYNVNLKDVIPATLAYENASVTNTDGIVPDSGSLVFNIDTLAATYTKLDLGESSTIEFQVRPVDSVYPDQLITNAAELDYTSLPNEISTPQSTYNNLSVERTGDENDAGGAVNDYISTSFVDFTVNNVNPNKTIVATSEDHTTTISSLPRLAIGEIVRYRLATRIPEGEIENFRVRDNLPNELLFLNDNTSTIGFSSNGNLTSDIPDFSSCNVNGSSQNIALGCNIPSSQISPSTFSGGTDPIFAIGNIANTDDDTNNEFIIIEFNALVLNTNNAQAFNQITGDTSNSNRNNRYTAIREDSSGDDVNMARSNNRRARIAEPLINDVTKTTTQTPTDSADSVTYEITFSNLASGDNAASAFDLNLTDTLDANLELTSVSVTSKPTTTTLTDNSSFANNLVDFDFDVLAPNEGITIEVTAKILSTVSAGQVIPNTASVTYTSLPGGGTTTNPTGSTPPTNIERNGSLDTPVNDYVNTNTTEFTIGIGSVSKANVAGSNFRIGDEPEFDITVNLIEGLNKNTRVVDKLPVGLEYISSQVITTAANSNGLLAQDFSSTLPTPAESGTQNITFGFGDITLPDDNNTDNNSFVIRVKTRVTDIPTNQNNTNLTNNTDLVTTNVASNNDQTAVDLNPPEITIIIPVLGIVKKFDPVAAAPNDTVTIELEVTNTGLATAYEVNIEDTLSNSELINPTLLTTATGFSGSINPSGNNTSVNYAGGDIDPNQTLTFTFEATLESNLVDQQVIPNIARITSGSTQPGVSINERILDPVATNTDLLVITPDLEITKTNSTNVITPGSLQTYTITVENVGGYRADNIVVTENLPDNTTFSANDSLPTVWTSGAGQTYTTDISSLEPNTSVDLTFAVVVDDFISAGVSEITNTVSAIDDGSHGQDPTPNNNTFTDTDSLDAAPDIEVTKDDGVTEASPGDILTYTISIKNT